MYRWLRHGLFQLEPEKAHDLAMASLDQAAKLGLIQTFYPPPPDKPVELMGLRFKNPVGLAAGLDKNADHLDTLGQLGFGFIEVGTVTPKPQPGNPKPRLFRLTQHEALINRLGFNNQGVDHLVERLQKRTYSGIVGANVGKQKDTPIDKAAGDYIHCMEKVYPYCDYITVNISSPNTQDLRQLQTEAHLSELLEQLVETRQRLGQRFGHDRPVLIKIAPDWEPEALQLALETLGQSGIDGLIATNTTLDRRAVAGDRLAQETGGLSGRPLAERANQTLQQARLILGPNFPIIGVGGVCSGDAALEKSKCGADLIQIYTGLIYRGPRLISECVQAWPS